MNLIRGVSPPSTDRRFKEARILKLMADDRFTSKTIPYARNSRLKVSVSSPPRESELFSIVCIETVT